MRRLVFDRRAVADTVVPKRLRWIDGNWAHGWRWYEGVMFCGLGLLLRETR